MKKAILILLLFASTCNADILYDISGAITPDAKGKYFTVGTYNGHPLYKRITGNWFLWNNSAWYISAAPGQTTTPCWRNISGIEGSYNPFSGATGNAICTFIKTYNPEQSGNCIVNFIDFSFFADDWLILSPDSNSDFDASGIVDINDLQIFCERWLYQIGHSPIVYDENFSLWKNDDYTFDINWIEPDGEAIWFTVESLPNYGVLWTSFGPDSEQITYVPYELPNRTIRYIAGDYNNVADSFIFAADDHTGLNYPCGGKTNATATVFIYGPIPPGKATNPVPEMNAVNVAIDVNLSWTTGQDANSHFVYLGTVLPPDFQGQQDGNLFDPNNLMVYDTNYFWQINESGPNGITTGDIWQFRTCVLPANPIAADVNVSVYNYVTNTITLSATDDGNPNPPGQLEYYIVSFPSGVILQDPCSENIIEEFMLPYSLSFYGNTVWYMTDANMVKSFTYKANDGNQPDGNSNIATVTVTMLNHPKDLLSFNEFGITEFNDTKNFYDANNGWAVDFWLRTKEPFAGVMKKRDVNQGYEIGIVSGAPKLYIYDVNATVVAEIQSFWRIDDGYWHEVAFNFGQDGNGVYLTVQTPDWGFEQLSFSGNFGSIENDCNLLITGYRGDVDMLRFFAGITNPGGFESIIQGLYNRDGSGFESWMGGGAKSKVRFPMNEGTGQITTDDKRNMVGTLRNADVRWYPFWYPFD